MARVLLLFGGKSAEHEVSCSSAVSVFDALEQAGHRVIPVGIDRSGAWFLADTAMRPFRAEGRPVSFMIPSGSIRVGDDEINVDVAFPVLHGPRGEDGTVHGAFEVADLPYVGCGVMSSAVAMDKDLTKQLVAAAGIDTSPWVAIRRSEWDTDPGDAIDRALKDLGLPVFVKPAAQGSSVGIEKVEDPDGLKDAIGTAFRYDDKVIIEQGIDAREIEVAVLDGPRASQPGEVIVSSGWYTYDAKYADDSSRFEAPADLTGEQAGMVRMLAERVYELLECSGLARVDFLFDRSTRRFLLNEINTMPGFTSISGFPKMWIASGMTYPELCDHLVAAAFSRHEARARLAIR